VGIGEGREMRGAKTLLLKRKSGVLFLIETGK